MTGYDDMPTEVDEALEQVHAARAEIEAIIERLSPGQMTLATDDGGWSIKDHLAHIADWQRHGIGRIEGRTAWDSIGIERETFLSLDTDGINEIIFQRNKDRPLNEVLTEFRKAQERVILTIEQMNEDDLERTIADHAGEPRDRIREIIEENFSGHDREHVEDIRQLANQPID
jgi:uncharacterized damage-inducible protein DinB